MHLTISLVTFSDLIPVSNKSGVSTTITFFPAWIVSPRLHLLVTEDADTLDSNRYFPRIVFPVALLPDHVRSMSTIRISLSTPNSTVDVSEIQLSTYCFINNNFAIDLFHINLLFVVSGLSPKSNRSKIRVVSGLSAWIISWRYDYHFIFNLFEVIFTLFICKIVFYIYTLHW